MPHFAESKFAENPCHLLIFLKRKCRWRQTKLTLTVTLNLTETLSVIGVGVSAVCDYFQSELRVNNRPLMPHWINLWTNFDANSHATSKKILLPVGPDCKIVFYRRPWPLGPVIWPSRAIRWPRRPKYHKNERQGAADGQTGSENMATTRNFDSAILTSYSTPYTLWGLSLTVTEFAYENANITPC